MWILRRQGKQLIRVASLTTVLALPAQAQNWTLTTIEENIRSPWTRAGDIDNDGDPDVFVQNGDSIFWYENIWPGWESHLVDPLFLNSTFGWTEEVDLDKDGHLDFTQVPFWNPGTVAWNRNLGDGTGWERRIIATGMNTPAAMQGAFGDIDGDDDNDLVIPKFGSGAIAWYQNSGDTAWTKHPLGVVASMIWGTVADMDSDNDLDVIGGANGSGTITWYENLLPDTAWPGHLLGTLPGTIVGDAADLDQDGDEDIVTHGQSAIFWYETPAGTRRTVISGILGMHLGRLGDVDSDGDTDITFGGDGFGTEGRIGWVENVDSASTWILHEIDDPSILQRIPTGLADIDGDGDTDFTSFLFDVGTGFGDAIWYANPEVDPVSVTSTSAGIPSDYRLEQNYPNPFNPTTTIRFDLPSAEHVRLEVFNLLGQMVMVGVDRVMDAGNHDVALSAGIFPGGVYFYRLEAGEFVAVRKMVLVK